MSTTPFPPRAIALLVFLTLIWGTNWPLFAIVLQQLSVWTFRAVSLAGAGLFLLGIARARGLSLAVGRAHRGTLALGAFSYLLVWNVASAYSAKTIASGQSAVLGFTMPLWAALLSAIFLGERLQGRALLAMALGAVGVLLLLLPGLQAYAEAPFGFAAGLTAGLGWAVGTLIMKRRPVPVPGLVLTGWQLLLAALPLAAVALVAGQGAWHLPDARVMAIVAYITFIPMALGNLAWFSIVGLLPANVAGLSTVLVPVVAMLSGAWARNEPLGPPQLAAMACCVGALALSVLKPARAS